jgi:phage baseplate assembly protein W
MLFENFNQNIANRVSAIVGTEVTRWDPRIQLRDIQYEPDQNNATIKMTVLYSLVGSDNVLNIEMLLKG